MSSPDAVKQDSARIKRFSEAFGHIQKLADVVVDRDKLA
jgi:hypothetical protein